jgi:hypothetical protein
MSKPTRFLEVPRELKNGFKHVVKVMQMDYKPVLDKREVLE